MIMKNSVVKIQNLANHKSWPIKLNPVNVLDFLQRRTEKLMFFYSIQHTKVQVTDHNALHPIVFYVSLILPKAINLSILHKNIHPVNNKAEMQLTLPSCTQIS